MDQHKARLDCRIITRVLKLDFSFLFSSIYRVSAVGLTVRAHESYHCETEGMLISHCRL